MRQYSGSEENALEVKGLNVGFRGRKGIQNVVSDVSFSIRQGETVALVGESGSGKSVTSFSILRLLERSGGIVSGQINFNSPTLGKINLLEQTDSVMRSIRGNQISMIFQEPMTSLNPLLTVGYQITETLRAHRDLSFSEAKKEALVLLDKVQISNALRRFDEYPSQFSGGMRQRVVIAMALACRPTLLIADEPTTALDVTTQARILDIIKDLQREMNMAVLFISHDLGLVAEVADRAMVMYCGKLVEETGVDSLFFSPGHPYTSGLLHSMPAAAINYGKRSVLSTIPGSVPALTHLNAGCSFAPRCLHALEECRKKLPLLEKQQGRTGKVACHRSIFLRTALSQSLPWVQEEIASHAKTA